MKIGELARIAGCAVDTVRFYERAGILPAPARTASNYRVYTAAHMDELALVLRCRALDMSLDEIRLLLEKRHAPESDCDAVNELLDQHMAALDLRIAELTRLKEAFSKLRQRCSKARTAAECGILRELEAGATATARRVTTVPGN
ncbi:Cd(II)/Pb(II)-responsive transcriptional regulator [Paraburkholderia sartisoli]|uniref:Cd(II)/Pb(II)-responsive transcriptional regulator n=1 Tax=Paraburkholderia sartisoli TaxID=83784 RepID=A0A1H4G7P0_9BURK|nr:Cd(II)/Pb(II)-responsive transcriptional regulator [Paraburkholderia sartisoli]SEB05609.1 Cd(II)/Pb(II)-responsive transcriptional regulator [Paraburkholderia sartisoli]